MKKIFIFLLVGGSSALIDVGSLYLLSKVFLLNNTISITIAFLLGLVFNYLCHTYITFGNSANGKNLIKYLVVVLVNYLTTLFLISLMQSVGVELIIAKLITLPVIASITFVLSNKWVYK